MSHLPPAMRYALLVVVAAGAAACGLLEPSADLSGQWGGRDISLDARGSDVRVRLPCSSAVAPHLRIDGAGHFEGTAQVTGSLWAPTQLRLSGKIGMLMTLDIAAVWPPNGARTDTLITHQSYTLLRGGSPDFSAYDCLA